jgi:iron complex outermembrane receptor protein
MQTTIFGQSGYTAPSNTLTDLRALYKDADDRYTIIGYVKNVTDEVAYQSSGLSSATAIGTLRQTVKLNFPRTYGVELQYRF